MSIRNAAGRYGRNLSLGRAVERLARNGRIIEVIAAFEVSQVQFGRDLLPLEDQISSQDLLLRCLGRPLNPIERLLQDASGRTGRVIQVQDGADGRRYIG